MVRSTLLVVGMSLWGAALPACGSDDAPIDAASVDSGLVDSGSLDDARPPSDAPVPDGGGAQDAPASDAGGCATGEMFCGAGCVVTATDPDHCGSCDTVCGAGQICRASSCVDVAPAGEADLTVDTVATDLEVVWEIRFLPSGDLLVTERPGRLTRVAIADGAQTVLATLPVTTGGETGLMGLALDPDFETNGHVYVCYSYRSGGVMNRVSRLTVSGETAGDEMILLDAIPGASNHDGCRLGFGPDDKLYVTTGDGAVPDRAQDPSSLNGKVLRMNADGSVPADNPFPDSLVYTLGHRNPQGLDWHRTGVLFVSEHGPSANDEINRLQSGLNYGWPTYGGAPGVDGYEDSVYAWTPTIAPAGGVFYDRTEIRGWRGSYLLVTLKEADLRRLTASDADFTTVDDETILFDGDWGRLRAIRVGPDGWIYIGTSARDGRGSPGPDDDRILRIRM